jgi:hypothetical protein
MLFANLQGFKIGVSVEFAKGEGSKSVAPVDKSKDDRDDDDSTRDQTEDQSQSDCHWKRGNAKDKEKAKDTGASCAQLPSSARPMDHLATPLRWPQSQWQRFASSNCLMCTRRS